MAVKVLVKDDMPLFLQQKPLYHQKTSPGFYPEAKSDLGIYDPFDKGLPHHHQKYASKALQESMLSLCQQYSTSMQLFPYFNYYHPSILGSLASHQEEDLSVDHRD